MLRNYTLTIVTMAQTLLYIFWYNKKKQQQNARKRVSQEEGVVKCYLFLKVLVR